MKNIITSLVLIFLVFTSTSIVYAKISPSNDAYLNSISDYYIVDQKLVSDQHATLIPMGEIQGVDDVYYIDYEYEVVVKKGMDLHVDINDLLFSKGQYNYDDLSKIFNFNITKIVESDVSATDNIWGLTEEAIRIKVQVRVSMNELDSYQLFKDLAGGQLAFNVYFFAA